MTNEQLKSFFQHSKSLSKYTSKYQWRITSYIRTLCVCLFQTHTHTRFGEGMENPPLLLIMLVGRDVKLYGWHRKYHGTVQKLKNRTAIRPRNSASEHLPQKLRARSQGTKRRILDILTAVKLWVQPTAHWWMSG